MLVQGLMALLGLGLAEDTAIEGGVATADLDVIQVVFLNKGPKWTDTPSSQLDALHASHQAHIDAMWRAGQAEVCGETTFPSGDLQQICIYRASTPGIARTWAEQDPAVLSGHLRVQVVSWALPAHWMTFPNSQRPGEDDALLDFASFDEDDFIASLGLSSPAAPQAECSDTADATAGAGFDDVDYWSVIFDDPARDEWQKPSEVVELLGLSKGMRVADIGAGTGYFNRHLADAVGKRGRVLAVDVERSMVDHMAKRAKTEGTPQVMPRLARAEDAGLLPNEVDRVLMVDSYRFISEPAQYFSRLRASLRPGGQLMVVDYRPGVLPVGPPPNEKLLPGQVKAELEAAGWVSVAQYDTLTHQLIMVFEVAQ